MEVHNQNTGTFEVFFSKLGYKATPVFNSVSDALKYAWVCGFEADIIESDSNKVCSTFKPYTL